MHFCYARYLFLHKNYNTPGLKAFFAVLDTLNVYNKQLLSSFWSQK
jgi:hypothetical protein